MKRTIATLTLTALFAFAACDKQEKAKPTKIKPKKTYTATYKSYHKNDYNSGHRMGGGVFKELPDNTIETMRACIDARCHEHDTFKYFELDIVETKDGALMVHHDKCFTARQYRKSPLYKKCIKDLTADQVATVKVWRHYNIPTLHDMLQATIEEGFSGRFLVEVKNLHSNKARQELINTVNHFNQFMDVDYLAFRSAFNRSFPNKKKWCAQLETVYEPYKPKDTRNNLCKRFL